MFFFVFFKIVIPHNIVYSILIDWFKYKDVFGPRTAVAVGVL